MRAVVAMSPEVISAMAKIIANRHPWTGKGEPRLQGEVEYFLLSMRLLAGAHGHNVPVEPHSIRGAHGTYVVGLRHGPKHIVYRECKVLTYKTVPPALGTMGTSVRRASVDRFEAGSCGHQNMPVIWRVGAL